MKTILNEEQFNRFKELQKNREIGMKKKGLKKKKAILKNPNPLK